MKILSENSLLKQLPIEIDKREFLIFDAVRFSLEILEHNFKSLEGRLLALSDNGKKEVPVVFSYAWNIIDYTDRIRELLIKLPWEKPDEIIGDFKYLKDIRNTIQHLGVRRDLIINKKSPLFGILSWFYKDLETGEITPHSLVSGITRDIKIKWSVPKLNNDESVINNIILQTVADGKLVNADFYEILRDLRKLSKDLENRIDKVCKEKKVNALNWEKRQDILIKFKNGAHKYVA